MRTAQQDQPGRQRRVTGAVSAAGAVTAGSGFTIIKGAAGGYTIRIPEMRALLAANATLASNASVGATITQPDTIAVTAAADTAFMFHATGISQ